MPFHLAIWVSKVSEKFRLNRKIGFQITFYTYCINVIIDSIGPVHDTFQKANNKGADQTARMGRLVCACVVRNPPPLPPPPPPPPEDRFSRVEAQMSDLIFQYFLLQMNNTVLVLRIIT